MSEIKINKIALLLFGLVVLLIMTHSPFFWSLNIPVLIRLAIITTVVSLMFFIVVLKKYFLKFYLPFLIFLIVLSVYWLTLGGDVPETIYTYLYILLAIVLMLSIKRIAGLKILIVNLYFYLVVIIAIQSIISFFAFNFELLPYSYSPTGEGDDIYQYYFNYLLGYINPKIYDFGPIGRVTSFLFEPSYLGWFFSTNLLLAHHWVKKREKRVLLQILIFVAALSTFSTMCWLVLGAVLISFLIFKSVEFIVNKKSYINMVSASIIIGGIFTIFSFVGQDKFFEALGPSSSDDRNDRIETSMLYLATASPTQLFLGRSPGYITSHNNKGESNPIIKLLVEEGLLLTILVIVFVVKCTYQNKFYMIATILWLNSVVILFTPLFILNLLVSKWVIDIDKDGASISKAELTENLIEN